MNLATITITFYGYTHGVESHFFSPPYRDTLDQKYYLTGWESEQDLKGLLDTIAYELHYLSGHGIDSIAIATEDFSFSVPYAERYIPYDGNYSYFAHTLQIEIGMSMKSSSVRFSLPRVDAFRQSEQVAPDLFQKQIQFLQIRRAGRKKRETYYDRRDPLVQSFLRKILGPTPILHPFSKTFTPMRWHCEFSDNYGMSVRKLPKRQMTFYKVKARLKKEQEAQRLEKRLERAGVKAGERKPQKKAAQVYIIQMQNDAPILTCKIGVSNAPEKRLKALQTSNPHPLEIVHSFSADPAEEAEKCLHARYQHSQLNGEWFQLTPEQLNELRHITRYQQGEFLTS